MYVRESSLPVVGQSVTNEGGAERGEIVAVHPQGHAPSFVHQRLRPQLPGADEPSNRFWAAAKLVRNFSDCQVLVHPTGSSVGAPGQVSVHRRHILAMETLQDGRLASFTGLVATKTRADLAQDGPSVVGRWRKDATA